MIDPTKLFEKKEAPPTSGSPATTPEEKAPGPSAAPAPDPAAPQSPSLEIPPGLPQAYVDANLKSPPIPTVLEEAQDAPTSGAPQTNFKPISNPTLRHVDNIPYAPGREPKVVTERVSQGPRQQFAAQPSTKEGSGAHEEKKVEKVIHPDTSKPGRVVRKEPHYYRPV